MRFYITVFLFAAMVLAPVLSSAAVNQAGAVQSGSIPIATIIAPGRDDVDEDSVILHYGFEDGFGDWTTVDLTNPGYMWHITEEHAFNDESSWWCADTNVHGYSNLWLQFILTPEINLSDYESAELNFMVFWDVEDPEPSPPAPPWDGWDGGNVWISVGGGDWEVLEPETPEYNYRSLYSFGMEWNMGEDIPGWCGRDAEWFEGNINLDEYAGEESIQIRWAFASDPMDDSQASGYIGFLVDEMEIVADGEVIWSNNADEVGDMQFDTNETSGDFWEITDDDAHEGDQSAHCPVDLGLQDALVSPPLDIPGNPWYTYFEYWVRADARNTDPNNDDGLDDYYNLEISEDGLVWDQVHYHWARDPTWYEWNYFGPDIAFNRNMVEWKFKQNLTQFGGQTVYLRWIMKTDHVMGDDEGSGLWIDDFRLKVSSRRENDASLDWIRIGYPTALNFPSRCDIGVSNKGMLRLINIWHFYQIDNERPIPIVPFEGMDPDTSKVYRFNLDVGTIPYADEVTFRGNVRANPDDEPRNDSKSVSNVVIYPENVWLLGYDNHDFSLAFRFEDGHGPAIFFTPEDDGIGDDFDVNAVRVIWNGFQGGEQDFVTTMHFFEDLGGRPGNEIYARDLTITRNLSLPNTHVIDLVDVEELKGMDSDFWLWFEVDGISNRYIITGDNEAFDRGHFFDYNGNVLSDMQYEFQVHPVVMPAGQQGTMVAAGKDEIEFGAVRPGSGRTIQLAVFNTGTTEAIIEGVESDSEIFEFQNGFDTPQPMQIGGYEHIWVEFLPQAEEEYEGNLTITTNAGDPIVVHLTGVGDVNASAPAESGSVPCEFSLGQAYPNPFNARAVIPFSITQPGEVSLAIYDLNGRRVADLVLSHLPAGNHQVVFNAETLSTGVYIYRLQAEKQSAARKIVLVK